jgi:hypothetical protein
MDYQPNSREPEPTTSNRDIVIPLAATALTLVVGFVLGWNLGNAQGRVVRHGQLSAICEQKYPDHQRCLDYTAFLEEDRNQLRKVLKHCRAEDWKSAD